MSTSGKLGFTLVITLFLVMLFPMLLLAANEAVVLNENELPKVVPIGFYFEGQSAATQMRNAAAVRFGTKRYVVTALVDTSGYASDIRAKCEGFLITDSAIVVGGKPLGIGSWVIGLTKEGMLNVFDLSGAKILSLKTTRDTALKTPKPVNIVKGSDGVRLYRGRDYVIVAPQ
jgi:hypothetical protein